MSQAERDALVQWVWDQLVAEGTFRIVGVDARGRTMYQLVEKQPQNGSSYGRKLVTA
jgi:hypothetical protein